jgi:hypothetical protein
MKLLRFCSAVAVLLFFVTGCKKTADPTEEIRAAIQRRLNEQGTLNLSAFDTEIKQLTVQGDHAQADVIFRVKNGQGSMQLSYNLEKRNGVWIVLDSKQGGADSGHPAPGQGDPAAPGGANSPAGDALRNFNAQPAGAPPNLPPGHPPVNPNPPPAPQKKP